MWEANLEKANLLGANLQYAELWEANLEKAYLLGANLQEARLTNANLEKADFGGGIPQQQGLRNANLQGASFGYANLQGANFGSANLQGANLTNANLQEANLTNTEALTNEQIKSACNWEKAYFAKFMSLEEGKWIVDEKEQKARIKELKEDKTSDPQEKPDCYLWKYYSINIVGNHGQEKIQLPS